MPRSVPTWRGKTDDSPIPARVKQRIFDRAGGICHISGRHIEPGDEWDADHITPLSMGGEHSEDNLAPALRVKHREKTSQEATARSKADRIRQKHLGIKKPKRSLWGNSSLKRKVDGTVVKR